MTYSIHIHYIALEPVEEIQIVNVSEGGSIELSCMKGAFPNPTNIIWWRNNDRCDTLQPCLVSDNSDKNKLIVCIYTLG